MAALMSAQGDKYKFLSRSKALGKLRKPKSRKKGKSRKLRPIHNKDKGHA